MSEEFHREFGAVELGPKDWPGYGKALYERTRGAIVKRYELEPSGWAVDTKTRERAFRLDGNSQVVTPSGRKVPWPNPLPAAKPDDTSQRLFGTPPAKVAARSNSAPQSSIAEQIYKAPSPHHPQHSNSGTTATGLVVGV